MIQLIFLSFRGAPEFLATYHVLFSLSLKLFYVDSFIAGASKTQEDTLKVFITKVKICKDNGDRNSNTTITTEMAG